MNDENKIGLSIEMYEDLKETLVKAVKSTKANAGLENAQLERIERLIEATELSQGQVAQMLEQLQRHTALPGVKTEQERELAFQRGGFQDVSHTRPPFLFSNRRRDLRLSR